MNRKTDEPGDIMKLPVHHHAEAFAMLPEDELAELAQSISESGLREPLIVSKVGGKWMLVDGRNRREACRLAKVKPEWREIPEDQVTDEIVARGVHRRHSSKGQLAMALAMIYPEPAKLKRGGASCSEKEQLKISKSKLSEARAILRELPELANDVRNGEVSLAQAYETTKSFIQHRKSQAELEKRLKIEDPDLYEGLAAGNMTLAEAVQLADQRRASRKQADYEHHRQNITWLYQFAKMREEILGSVKYIEQTEELAKELEEHYRGGVRALLHDAKEWRGIDAALKALREAISART